MIFFWLPPSSMASVDPGQSHVESGIDYNINGSAKTGTYTGANRWTDPGASNVSNGVTYLANTATMTGTLDSVTNVISNTNLTGPSYEATLEAE